MSVVDDWWGRLLTNMASDRIRAGLGRMQVEWTQEARIVVLVTPTFDAPVWVFQVKVPHRVMKNITIPLDSILYELQPQQEPSSDLWDQLWSAFHREL